jgi:hypothetical protein
MDELGLDAASATTWFTETQSAPFRIYTVGEVHADLWAEMLSAAVRRCYVTDDAVLSHAEQNQVPQSVIISAKLPDPGSVMAGDFGEILVYVLHAAKYLPRALFGPKKWRLKQDRLKPAPHSDVVQMYLPSWPVPSAADELVCSEVKTKSTPGSSTPIANALADSIKDQTSRLARTLVWLRERALTESLGNLSLAQLARFIDATAYPPYSRHFHAVAVLCSSLISSEINAAAALDLSNPRLTIVVVPNLKSVYTAVFTAAQTSGV